MALTATATPQVLEDIRMVLQLTEAPTYIGNFDRPNIFYKIKYRDSLDASGLSSSMNEVSGSSSKGVAGGSYYGGALGDLVKYIQRRHERAKKDGVKCSGIVYVHKRDDTQLIANAINKSSSSSHSGITIKAGAYHAGLKDAQRTQIQVDWSTDKIQVAVATVAFGMGIDLPHVRYVIHWSIPKSIEGFYQESGRAGRDGLPSHSVVYFSTKDVSTFSFLLRKQYEKQQQDNDGTKLTTKLQALEKMVDYCTTPTCRRAYLLRHFTGGVASGTTGAGVDASSNNTSNVISVDCHKTCDYCNEPEKVERAIQAAAVVKDVLQQHRTYNRKKQNLKEWDGQWMKPHNDYGDDGYGDEEDYARDWGDDNEVDGLRITGPACGGGGGGGNDDFENSDLDTKPKGKPNFLKASSILAKYEMLECQENNSNGFVRFRQKTTGNGSGSSSNSATQQRPTSSVNIPDHLRAALPDPLKQYETSKAQKAGTTTKSSAEHAQEAARLKEDLAKLQAERDARMKALKAKQASRLAAAKSLGGTTGACNSSNSTTTSSAPPPPPASLAFGTGSSSYKKHRTT